MDINGSEIGLGVGAFITTVLAWLKLKPKPENDMPSILKRISNLEESHHKLEDFCKIFMESTRSDYIAIKEDVTEIKADMKSTRDDSNRIANSVSRMEGIYEATFKNHER